MYDQRRTEFLESRGYTIMRFWDDEVLTQTDAVLNTISKWLASKQIFAIKDE